MIVALPVRNATITNAFKDPLSKIVYKSQPDGKHPGIDFIGGSQILATLDGIVHEVANDPRGWGLNVILEVTAVNGKKYHIIHAHLSKQLVHRGQHVKEGEVIGLMGSTGNSTGVHLHYEVRPAPYRANKPIDPAAFLGIENKRGVVRSTSSNVEPDIPIGPNIIPFKVGKGYLEELPERTIAHQDKYNYLCFWKDGRVTEHHKDRETIEWK